MMLATVVATAVALPVLVGWRASAGGRWMNASAVTQALAWGALLLARPVHDRLFSTLWIALLGASLVCIWHALDAWLPERPGRGALHAVALLTPLGYGLGFDSYAFRVGWSNFGLALLLGGVGLACAWPAQGVGRRWRGVVLASAAALAAVTLGRGILGAFFTELYPQLRTPHPLNLAGAMLQHIAMALITLSLLAAWHDEAGQALKRLASTDGLTGLLNRRACTEHSAEAFTMARRRQAPLAVLLLDLDHFKQINDTLGHEGGRHGAAAHGRAAAPVPAPDGPELPLGRRGVPGGAAAVRPGSRRGGGREVEGRLGARGASAAGHRAHLQQRAGAVAGRGRGPASAGAACRCSALCRQARRPQSALRERGQQKL
ncbi:GGDEF domain-containing protein [Azohydromonas sp. G-1-1-14]|uniref:diguanylate cyclase n=1 Tax=Azohydromonas caseinilytica TaxID=2728836 RepID=A0A848F9C1_9BURK|nr:GGDEF domain-containing protein [Azohydromonas caseinilytica]NML16747.1 GGDEF domain-containing protein [Azohydromonas caseinilytica]